MRSSKSRSRSKNNRNRNSLGNVVNRVFDSNGPEGKVRGTPQQIIDKYNQLARDAGLANDRVATENFQQHAEHYLRMLSEAQREQEARREQQERENRERQAQRDRERGDRSGGDQNDTADNGDQPMAVSGAGADAGLVDTPESRGDAGNEGGNGGGKGGDAGERPRKPRRKRAPAPEGEGGQDQQADAGQDEGQAAEKPKRAPRKRRAPAQGDNPDTPTPSDTPDAAE